MTYSDNVLDKALASATPVHPVASDGRLPVVRQGGHCYLLGRDGLFVMGQGCGFCAIIRLCHLERETPFGSVKEGLFFSESRVPKALVRAAGERAIADNPIEWAGAIVLKENGYALTSVGVDSASAGHITYRRDSYDDHALVVDMHSHGNGAAYFSATDDKCDAEGVYIAVVFGRCEGRTTQEVLARVTINGHFMLLDMGAWMEEVGLLSQEASHG